MDLGGTRSSTPICLSGPVCLSHGSPGSWPRPGKESFTQSPPDSSKVGPPAQSAAWWRSPAMASVFYFYDDHACWPTGGEADGQSIDRVASPRLLTRRDYINITGMHDVQFQNHTRSRRNVSTYYLINSGK